MNDIQGRGKDEIVQAAQLQKKPIAARPKQPPMPKAKALALTHKLKNALVVASILCFGSLGGVILSHTSIATAAQTTTKQTTATTTSTSTQSSQAASTSNSSSTSSSQQGGGYGFGTSNSTSTPVSGSHTS